MDLADPQVRGKVDEEEVPCRAAGPTTYGGKIERSADAFRAVTTARVFPS
jgi:hypothetical protein